MGLLERSNAYWKFVGQCTQCGHCTKACESLVAADMTLGDIAKAQGKLSEAEEWYRKGLDIAEALAR